MHEYLDSRYANALFEVASEENKVDEFIADLKQINELINKNEELNQIIKHPKISTSRKKELFKNIFEDKIDKELLSFLLILIEKNRINELSGIILQVEKILLERNNEVRAIVKTVIPLNEAERASLIDKLKAKYKKSIILEENIDADILGGVYVRIGDDVIDGTIKNKLDEIKKLMLIRG